MRRKITGLQARVDLDFSRRGDCQKVFENFIFLGRTSWFSELSQSSKENLFWPSFMHCRQNFEKKLRFFGTHSLLKIKIRARLEK